MHRNVYDLHRKFGSEMATESSRKIDGENPSLSGISHASRAFSLLLAGGALANYLKLTALRPLGFSRTSPYRSKLLTALHEKSPALCAELQIVCGEGGIRTPGTSPFNGFQDRRNRPLCHLSSPCKTLVCFVWDCKGRYFFLFCNFYLLKTTRFLFFFK